MAALKSDNVAMLMAVLLWEQVSALPRKALVDQFGEERATFIARSVAGYSDEPVQARCLHACTPWAAEKKLSVGKLSWHSSPARRHTGCSAACAHHEGGRAPA